MSPAQHATLWSAEDNAYLESLVLAGLQAREVWEKFPGRSLRAIQARYKTVRKAHGLSRDYLPPDSSDIVLRRIEAERGCRMLKEATDRYYANRLKLAA